MGDLFTSGERMEAARVETGLEDFGTDAWRDGLDVLLDSAAREAELNAIGREILRGWIHKRLVNRLRVTDWITSHPEVHDQRIEHPLIVTGMLRTGTTLLCELLGCDPESRALMKWEGLDSVPPPEQESFETDPRIARSVAAEETTYAAVPQLRAVHFEPGDGPTECVALLTQAFRSQDWYGIFHVPSYLRWLHDCDLAPGYAYHALVLKLLQTRAPGRWSLKAPGHLLALDALMACYPDARIVVTHRDPLRTVASSASLSYNSRPDSLSHAKFEEYFGRLWLETNALMVDRMMEYRDREASANFYDLHYDVFVKDPISEIRRLYTHFGESLGPEAERRMRAHLGSSPYHRYGSHRYSLEQFGLRADAVRERFAAYTRRFDIAPEEVRNP